MDELSSFLGIYLSDTLLTMRRFLSSEFETKLKRMKFEDWMYLSAIAKTPGLSQKHLGEKIVREKTIVSRMVDNWVKIGWVKREPSLTDKRVNGLFLSSKGWELWKKGIPIVQSADLVFRKNLSDGEEQNLYLTLFKIQSSIQVEIESIPKELHF